MAAVEPPLQQFVLLQLFLSQDTLKLFNVSNMSKLSDLSNVSNLSTVIESDSHTVQKMSVFFANTGSSST